MQYNITTGANTTQEYPALIRTPGRLEINPTARVKNTPCPFQLVTKINMSGVCSKNIDWKHNHLTDNLEASNFKTLSQKSVDNVLKLDASKSVENNKGCMKLATLLLR